MGCKCGGGGGPIIVRPEINLDEEITVEAIDHELHVLCDATGTPFLRRYTVDGGTVTTTDTELDGTTSFTPVDPVSVCAPDGDESPGQACLHCQTLRLFDDGTPFLRTVCRDCAGQVVSTTDTTVDGGDYTVVGEVTTCCPDDESPGDDVDYRPVVLCDDGTPFVRTYTLTGGAVIGFADTDLVGDPYLAAGTVGVCGPTDESPGPECDQTTPLTTVGLCLSDGTPSGVTAERDCQGTVTQTGWLDLTTGAWSAGAPPAGAAACSGDPSQFTLVGIACDVDANGDVLALVIIQYERDDTGQITGVTLIDAATGNPYTLQGTLTVCPAGTQTPEQDLVRLCDDDGAGTITPFLRDYRRDENGAIIGFTDYTLAGGAYTPTGTVGPCPASEPCGDTEAVMLCDDDGAGTVTPFLRTITYDCDGQIDSVADHDLAGGPYAPVGTVGRCPGTAPVELIRACDDTTGDGEPDTEYVILYRLDPTGTNDPTPVATYLPDLSAAYTPVAPISCCPPPVPPAGEPTATDTGICAPPNSGIVPLPGGGQALFDGGALTVPPDPDGSAGNGFRVNRAVAAQLQAERPQCDDGTATVTVSVQVCNDGPNPTPSDYAGSVCLFAPDCTGELLPHAVIAAPMQPGECQTLTTTVNVSAEDLAAGNLLAVLDTNTFSEQGPKGWTWDSWQMSYQFGTAGCANPDEGTGCCDQQVQNVKLCEPIVIKQTGDEQECASVIVNERCDDVNGDGSDIVGYNELMCISGSGTVRMLHTYRSTPTNLYSPNNPVPCGEPVPTLCGLDGEGESGDTGSDTFPVTDTDQQLRASASGVLREQVPGGGQALWDGGSVVVGPDTAPTAPWDIIHRWVAATLQADRPQCDDGTATVTLSVRVTNNGPNPGEWSDGIVALYSETDRIARVQVTKDAPVGHQETITITETVAAADLAAGRLAVWIDLETFHNDSRQWTADQFEASFSYGTDGCPTEVPVQYVKICGPVTIGGGMLSAGGSTGGGSSEADPARQVIERCKCDDTTGDGIGDVEYVELWSVATEPGGDDPQLLGIFTAEDLSQAYTPVAPVPCPAEDGAAAMCTVRTGAGRVRANPDPVNLDLSATIAGLQSVTVNVIAEPEVLVTTDNGVVPIPAGTALTWSVTRDQDQELGTMILDIPAGSDAILHFTYCESP